MHQPKSLIIVEKDSILSGCLGVTMNNEIYNEVGRKLFAFFDLTRQAFLVR
jgi:hypothetical protein